MLFLIELAALLAVIFLQWKFAFRMAREVSQYAGAALRDRSSWAMNAGQAIGYLLGFALWLPLLAFNVAIFRTAWPVTGRKLTPRQF